MDQDGDAWIFLLEKAEAWQKTMREGAKVKRAHEKYSGTTEWLAIKVPDLAYCNMDQSAWVVEPVEYALHAGDRPVSGMGG